jgi:hypothetical protein
MTFFGIYIPSRPSFRLKVAVMRPCLNAPNPGSLYGNMIDETETHRGKKLFGFYCEPRSDGLPQATLAITAETDSSHIP